MKNKLIIIGVAIAFIVIIITCVYSEKKEFSEYIDDKNVDGGSTTEIVAQDAFSKDNYTGTIDSLIEGDFDSVYVSDDTVIELNELEGCPLIGYMEEEGHYDEGYTIGWVLSASENDFHCKVTFEHSNGVLTYISFELLE